ncbi:hypothetical protein HF896_21975 [Alicycliphilus denitrificans]|uniref:DUF2946 domain-containing protein n=1 Tax=Alicycliphilus denitrificans TaxID=179636 RepID=A0A858ZYL5_9BURK|nr:DUF2946 family protein [Alicycliphilus denitrificans]ADV02016.1 hypothetical protein Alide_4315 [Alicycliphilus denitrificans BC]QKD46116.1 hypothetical protein HF896_21975 [Alicycliphilus denitrificans]GAO25613.1 hypothetical protein ALISP_5433 [Alicycliphilus sp. B1]
MLERIRHRRRLGTAVLAVFTLAWLVALFASVQVRLVLPQPGPLHMEVCSADPHEAAAPEADAHAGHHADSGCLLCIALGTPPVMALAAFRQPLPVAQQARLSPAEAVPAWRAQAPLPARGPPLSVHA